MCLNMTGISLLAVSGVRLVSEALHRMPWAVGRFPLHGSLEEGERSVERKICMMQKWDEDTHRDVEQ